ncbi:MAG: adenylosuccinate synthase [Rhabdochlamydiaceae bacterium]|nr:adenylosuccinate synthase [Candidatus Amphrikana amoebophyrae]
MSTLVIAGLSWGDEGKGKLVDLLSEKALHVVRAQGGHNAGHTVSRKGQEYHFHLLPSGILNSNCSCYLGAGVALYPPQLLKEIDSLDFKLKPNQLFISPYAHIIMPYHIQLDEAKESVRGVHSIGTTKRGIGPCYVDRVDRIGIRVCDLIDPDCFDLALKRALLMKKDLFEHYGLNVDAQAIQNEYKKLAIRLKPMVAPVEVLLREAQMREEPILIEGAQGALLDVNYGTYPFVTSSQTTTNGMLSGCSVAPTTVDQVLGVLKAYQTRVGSGPFPTQFSKEEACNFLSPVEAREIGVSTGRDRRMGWFDLPLAKYGVMVSNATSFALMKLDILDKLDKIKICTHYLINGEKHELPPHSTFYFDSIKPQYIELNGWKTSTTNIQNFMDLPLAAQEYCNFIQSQLKIPLVLVSTSPDRDSVIYLEGDL